MARVYTNGAELNGGTAVFEYTKKVGTGGLTTGTQFVKNSTYALRSFYNGGSPGRAQQNFYNTASTLDHYFAFDFSIDTVNGVTGFAIGDTRSIFSVLSADSASAIIFTVVFRVTGIFGSTPIFYDFDILSADGTTLYTGTTEFGYLDYTRIELFYSYANRTVTVKFNGVVETSLQNKVVVAASTGVYGILVGVDGPTLSKSFNAWYDNIRVNNTAGSANNSWLGEGYVSHLDVNGVVSVPSTDWRNASNATPTVADVTYAASATPPSLYIKRDQGTTIRTQEFNFTDSSTFSTKNTRINCIGLGQYVGSTSATTGSRLARAYIKSGASSVLSTDASNLAYLQPTATAEDWSINGWGENYNDTANGAFLVGSRPGMHPVILNTNPSTSKQFTYTDLNTILGGVTADSIATQEIRLAKIWIMVDWSPIRTSQGHIIDLQPT